MAGKLGSLYSDRYALGQNSDINVTPFVDIMLVLLIVFMVAIPAAVVSVKVDLPPAQAGSPPRLPTYVSLTKGGALFIGDRATSLATLAPDLDTTIGGADPRHERIYVRADKGVPYGAFMAVVSRLQASGYRSVGLVAEEL
ncbi:MAG: biopolymer transporter ExbD [Phenylobacterium sp.]